MNADPGAFPVTVEQVAQVVARDHVLVENTMGSGDAAGTARRLSAIVRTLPFPAYVALVSTPRDDHAEQSAQYLAVAISRRVGKPGLYIVDTPDDSLEVRLVEPGQDPNVFDLQYYANHNAVAQARGADVLTPAVDAEVALLTGQRPVHESADAHPAPTLSTDQIDTLAERDRSLSRGAAYDAADDEPSSWTTGKRWMLGTTVGLALLLLIQRTVRGWPGWRSRPEKHTRPRTPTLAELHIQASAALLRLSTRLARETRLSGRADEATLAHDIGESLLDSEDPADVLGALVLAQTGLHALQARSGVYHCCFVNPLHGEGTTTRSWRFGEADLAVPMCAACAGIIEHGGTPNAFLAGRHHRPYYERDDVWARTGYGSLVDDLAHQVAAARGAR